VALQRRREQLSREDFVKHIVRVVIALAFVVAGAARIPAQTDVRLDGTINEAEWKTASSRPLEGGGTIHLMTRGNLLYVGIRGPASGIAHVCVGSESEVSVLHVAAAVGSARFRRTGDKWTLQTPFTWSLRDPGLTGAAEEARTAYLKKEGWVGTISKMGAGTDREIAIDKNRFGERLRLSVAYLPIAGDKPGPVSKWPDLRDSCSDGKAVSGTFPDNPRFLVNDWAVVQ
jgi:hypothetical protein